MKLIFCHYSKQQLLENTNSNSDYATHRTSRMTQIKARFAGNGHPLARAATQSWGILDVPNRLKYKDRPNRVSHGRRYPNLL
jgi:hypothetical protein